MNIAYVIGACCPGGVVSYACEYSRRIVRDGHRVDCYIYAPEDQDTFSYVRECASNVVEIPGIGSPAGYFRALKAHFSESGYDVVHGFMNTLNFPSMLAAKSAGVPVRLAENLSTGSRLEPKSAIKAVLKPFGAAWSTSIAANSELAADWLFGKGASGRCHIVPNPIDAKRFFYCEDLRKRARGEFGVESSLVVGCVARFERQKNLTFLVDVFEEVAKKRADARLLLVGHGSMEAELSQHVTRKGLNGRVRFLDPNVDRNSVYNAMDVFVLPSLYEGMPIVALEAQATGLPCLLSSEVTRECSLDDMCTYLDLKDGPRVWAKGIVTLASSHTRQEGSLLLQESCFDADSAAKKLAALYSTLLGCRFADERGGR